MLVYNEINRGNKNMELQNSKDWAKVYRACNFIEKGVCEYANERVYVSQDALHKSMQTMKGRPVIIDHQTGITPENMQEYAVGYVTGVDINPIEAGCDCQFVIFDDKGKEVIADGYSVSCAYKPIAFGPGGTWHNVPYDREIVELEFTHLALVQNPRYEDAKVYENAKDRDGNEGRWITVKGTHVFIKDGQSVEDAMKSTFNYEKLDKGNKYTVIDQESGEEKSFDSHKEAQAYADKLKKLYKEDGIDNPSIDVDEVSEKGEYVRSMPQEDSLQGKYERDDVDFDPEQLKKDIKAAQEQGHQEIEDIAEFLGLDEDEVRETLAPTDKKDSNKQHKLQVKIDDLKSQENEIMKKYWEADEDSRDELQYKLDAIKEERLRLEDQVEEKAKASFDHEGFKKFVEGNKKKEEASISKTPNDRKVIKKEFHSLLAKHYKDVVPEIYAHFESRGGWFRDSKDINEVRSSKYYKELQERYRSMDEMPKSFVSKLRSLHAEIEAADIDQWKQSPQAFRDYISEFGSYLFASKDSFDDWMSREYDKAYRRKVEAVEEALSSGAASMESISKSSGYSTTFLQGLLDYYVKKGELTFNPKTKVYTKNKEKHNSKEDTMNVEEFFNKMGEMIEEKLNACKGKMNEADEEEMENEDDDKFEMDGEVYSKKELVNAFKEKKNAEEAEDEEEKEEEEKQNSNDEFFNAMEERMLQYNKESDKIEVYTQRKGLERGKAIYGK